TSDLNWEEGMETVLEPFDERPGAAPEVVRDVVGLGFAKARERWRAMLEQGIETRGSASLSFHTLPLRLAGPRSQRFVSGISKSCRPTQRLYLAIRARRGAFGESRCSTKLDSP